MGGEVTAVALLFLHLSSRMCGWLTAVYVFGSVTIRWAFDRFCCISWVHHHFFCDGVEALNACTISVNSGCGLQAHVSAFRDCALCMQVRVMLAMLCVVGVSHLSQA